MNHVFRIAIVGIVGLAAIVMLAHNSTGNADVSALTAPARHYYLTQNAVNGNQALTACATGYHFASFAELIDPSVLTYNKTLGRTAADSGSGPPFATGNVGGWIRTGSPANAVPNGSPTNCNVWTSGSGTDVGGVASFTPYPPRPGIAYADGIKCDNSDGYKIGVWCIQN